MRRARGILCGLSCLPFLARAHVFSLSELDWTLRNENGSIVIPGSLPSQVHIDLLKEGIIDEPLVGINEYTERWVVNDNWTYTADLTPFAQCYRNETTLLVFYGIDTIANITFAGHPVAWVNNEYQRYTYDVSGYLQSPIGDDKNLTIVFESAYHYGLNVTARPDAEPMPEVLAPFFEHEYPAFRFVRKMNVDFGWDISPAFMPSGVYKPAFLVTLSESRSIPLSNSHDKPTYFRANSAVLSEENYGQALLLSELECATSSNLPDNPTYPHANGAILLEETSVEIYKYGQTFTSINQSADWVVNITFGIRSAKSYKTPVVRLSIPELAIVDLITLGPIPAELGTTVYLSIIWLIPDGVPKRWYPHNLGAPKLYNFTITLDPLGSIDEANLSHESITQTITTGFRTIQLIQTAYPKEEIASRGITPGDQWHFEVNGKAFYTKGNCILPFDPFYSRINPDTVRWFVESAIKSGHNMLSIWGGGIYQPSDVVTDGGVYDFYSLCDELGILVWSELPFSDGIFPTNSWLMESIEPEVRQNVRRINRHPSNAHWVGGNEVEAIALFVESTLNSTHYVDEFIYLFQDFLHDIITSETISVPYTDSSLTHGVLSVDPYVLRLFNITPGYIYGDAGYYNFNATQAFNLSSYPVARFVHEFGFPSMPSFYDWLDVLENPEDFAFNSSVVLDRDRCIPPHGLKPWPNPNATVTQHLMTAAVELWLPMPGTSDANQTFAQWCWSTQVFQSMMTSSEIAWYRRGAGMSENNLGSVVYQLNNIWQGINWSAIEHSGRWKMMNYGLTSAFAPVTIRPFWMPENETLTVLVTSDLWETVEGVAQLTWYDWYGRTLNTSTVSFSVPSLNNSLIYERTGSDTIIPAGHNASDVWLLLNMTASVDNETVTNESYFTPVSLAHVNLVDPEIVMSAGDNYTFKLSAQGGVGVWTWLDHPYGTIGYFMDTETGRPLNGFYLIPGIDHTVQFVQSVALSTVQNPDLSDFVVRSIWNNTHI